MSIGQRMKAQRKALKISADELAARLGKDRSTIYRYEKGEIENVPLELLEPIAAALETTPQYLLGWNETVEEKEKPTVNDDGLSENQRKLIEFAKTVPEDKAEMILQVMRTIVEAD